MTAISRLARLRENTQHLYVISTHSPLALNDDPPDHVLMMTGGENESTVTKVDVNDQVASEDLSLGLPRRMLENCLLVVISLSWLLTHLDSNADTADAVSAWLVANGAGSKVPGCVPRSFERRMV